MTNDTSLLNLLLEQVPLYVFWKDLRFTYQGCNRQFAAALGFAEPKNIVGLTDYDLSYPRKDADFYRFCDERILEYDRAEHNIVESMLHADGRRVWLKTRKIPLHDATGAVCGLLGIAEDISEQIRLDERLRHYEVMASTVDDMMAIVSTDYRYLAVNNAYCTAYARPREDIIGRKVSELLGENLFNSTMKPHVERALSGTISQFEGWRIFPGSGERHIEYTYYPVFNDTEKVIGIVAKVHDNTRARRLETRLQQSQKMEAIGRLAGGVAHDFNNILSIINGYSDICLFEMSTDNPYRNKIEQINEAGNRAARLTQQLLGFSRKQIIQPQLLDLGDEIQKLKRMLKRLIGEDIAMSIQVDRTLWFVKMDRSQFEQIMLNLVVNARDAMAGSGRLTITINNHRVDEFYQSGAYAVETGDYVLLTCTDTGSGIPADLQSQIFEPFFTTKPKGAGTGFGLSTVYGIVKQNKGFISVESQVGTGSTFSLLLPRCLGSETSVQPRSEEILGALPGGSESILLVEDDHAVRKLCVTILTDLGYTVIEAGNGKEAVETAQHLNEDIDLLLTDVMMPEMNGPEAAAQLNERHPNLRVLYMSGYTEDVIVHHGVLVTGVHFLQKPVTPERLAQTVRRCLDSAD